MTYSKKRSKKRNINRRLGYKKKRSNKLNRIYKQYGGANNMVYVNDIYVNDETLIMSKHKDKESHQIVEIDKVSGWLKYFMIEPFDSAGVFKCTKHSRLME